MKKLLSLLLVLAVVFGFSACASKKNQAEIPHKEEVSFEHDLYYEELGKGEKHFFVEIKFANGDYKKITVKTDKETVGEALEEVGVVKGEEGQYGLYITDVFGEHHKYEEDGLYWAFYKDNEPCEKGADQTPIEESGMYSLRASE